MLPPILVIDDDPLNLRTLSRSLTRKGHEVVCARSASEGLSAIRTRGPFALVVCDRDMPRETGEDVLRRLRSEGDAHAGRFIFNTDNPRGLESYGVPVVRAKSSISDIETGLLQLAS